MLKFMQAHLHIVREKIEGKTIHIYYIHIHKIISVN